MSRLTIFLFYQYIFHCEYGEKGHGHCFHSALGSNPRSADKCLGDPGQVLLEHSNNSYLIGLLGEFKALANIKHLAHGMMYKK